MLSCHPCHIVTMTLNHKLACILPILGVISMRFDSVAASSSAANLRTQQIQLQKGWNSVFLEVVPQDMTPAIVFSNAPVSVVATYFPLANSVEFLADPVRINW